MRFLSKVLRWLSSSEASSSEARSQIDVPWFAEHPGCVNGGKIVGHCFLVPKGYVTPSETALSREISSGNGGRYATATRTIMVAGREGTLIVRALDPDFAAALAAEYGGLPDEMPIAGDGQLVQLVG